EPLADEVVEGGADGQSRDAEIRAELALRRDRIADAEPLDEIHHLALRLALLRHGIPHRAALAGLVMTAAPRQPGVGASSAAGPVADPVENGLRPVSGSKK